MRFNVKGFSSGLGTMLMCSESIKTFGKEVSDGRGDVGDSVRRQGSSSGRFGVNGELITQAKKGDEEMGKKRMVIKSKSKKQQRLFS